MKMSIKYKFAFFVTKGNYFESKMSINCLKIKLAWTNEKLRKWSKTEGPVLPSSTWLQMLPHVVVSQRTTKNCIKMNDARAGRAQFADVSVVLIKYADLWCSRDRCHCASFLTGWCLSIYDSNATNQEFDWWRAEKSACYSCGTHLWRIQCIPITCCLNTWKDHGYCGYIINRASVRVVATKCSEIYSSEMVWYFIGVPYHKQNIQVSYGRRRYERNLSTWLYKPEKVRTSTGFEPVTSRYRCDALTKWAIKPLTLGAGHLWVLMIPWRVVWIKWYMKYFIYWTADLKSSKLWSSQLWINKTHVLLQLRS